MSDSRYTASAQALRILVVTVMFPSLKYASRIMACIIQRAWSKLTDALSRNGEDAQILEQRLILAGLERNKLDIERELRSGGISSLGLHMRGMTFQTPLVLASVCRHWREIALSTPILWSTLYLDLDYASVHSKPHVIDKYIHRWLARAESNPLSLHFRLIGDDDEWLAGYTPHLLHGLLDRYADTIHFLEVNMSQNGIRQVGLKYRRFPVLNSPDLGLYPLDPENPVHLFGNAPLLTDIRFDGSSFYYDFPSSQLTKFDGEIETMDLFQMAPNLTEAICSVPRLRGIPQSAIIHLRLRSLILTESVNHAGPLDILEYLTLPALESLHVSEMDDTSYPSLTSFLERSSPPLRTLSVRVDDPEFFDWAECFNCVGPSLENLELESPSEEVQLFIFQYRNKPVHTVHRFPNLRTLTILNAPPTNYIALLDFLYKALHLRSFRLVSSDGAFLDDKIYSGSRNSGCGTHTFNHHLVRLAKQGMNINISTDTKTYVELVGHLEGTDVATWNLCCTKSRSTAGCSTSNSGYLLHQHFLKYSTQNQRRSCESMRGGSPSTILLAKKKKKLMLDIVPRRTFHKSFPCPVYPTLAT
ncbi:hypothetical protein B0H11DRAFT_2185826 [Mycena galericulata]|nr:hypothetical protein B0H11DRAFT_2185826 [Mycena galericulata]